MVLLVRLYSDRHAGLGVYVIVEYFFVILFLELVLRLS